MFCSASADPQGFSGPRRSLRLADWDNDGDVDVLFDADHSIDDPRNWSLSSDYSSIIFQERLADGTFQTHELLQNFRMHRKSIQFQVADWDGDQKLDLLLCFQDEGGSGPSRVHFLNRTLLPPRVDWDNEPMEVGSMILSVAEGGLSNCDMQFVDFDEDGDLDLFLGGFTRYFERQPTGLVERPQPFGIYNGRVLQIVDLDADGHLELLVNTAPKNSSLGFCPLGFLRRAHDGSFLESAENPFADIRLSKSKFSYNEYVSYSACFADWNSDGLLDFLVIRHSELQRSSPIRIQRSGIQSYYQQDRSRDMAYNSHLTVFENILFDTINGAFASSDEIHVLDSSQHGLRDHVLVLDRKGMRVYDVSFLHAQEVPTVLEGLKLPGGSRNDFTVGLADWDGDGDLDLLLESDGKLYYQERESGRLQPEQSHHQFSGIPNMSREYKGIFPVDWDRDGDMDLVLGDGRYFEQLADGSLQEQQHNPFRSVLTGTGGWCQHKCALRFLDCDGDGDLDVLRVRMHWVQGLWDHPRAQACEHIAGTLRCSEDFLCLGTDLSNFLLSQKFGRLTSLDVVNVFDGQLNLVAVHEKRSSFYYEKNSRAVLWTAGFCVPKGPCHGKGFCEKGELNCTCRPGHELGDCSRCKRNFHGVLRKVGQVRDCKRCAEDDGKVCRGRGDCFDDAAAQGLAEYTTAVMAAGNGSCRCYEAGLVSFSLHCSFMKSSVNIALSIFVAYESRHD